MLLNRADLAALIKAQSVMHIRLVDSYMAIVNAPVSKTTDGDFEDMRAKLKRSRNLLERLYKEFENG